MKESGDALQVREVRFYSAPSVGLSGHLYRPARPERRSEERVPAIVICCGLGGTKEKEAPQFARYFAEAGFMALTFDYRGWGGSDGSPSRIVPEEQVEDARAAASFLQTCPEVDSARLGIFGISFGGGIALGAAAVDPRFLGVVSLSGVTDGHRWLQQLQRYWEWRELLARVEEDRLRRTETGESRLVPSDEILRRDPDSNRQRLVHGTEYHISLESVGAINEYRPAQAAHRINGAVLLIHSVDDLLVPFDHAEAVMNRLGPEHPKRLLAVEGVGHYDFYQGQPFLTAAEASLHWFRDHLGGPSKQRAAC